MLGARPVAFNTVRFSEKILQKHGISTQTIDLNKVLVVAQCEESFQETAISAKEAEIRAYGRIPDYIDTSKIVKQAKLCLAMEKFVNDLDCQASTVQCWNSLNLNYGCAACLGMSMMGDKGKPSACESDVTGALSMLAANGPTSLMDWNNNIRDDRNSCISLHCSNFPKGFFKITKWKLAIWTCLEVFWAMT